MDPATAMAVGTVASKIVGAALGKKKAPNPVPAPQVNLADAQAEAIGANASNLPGAVALASRADAAAQANASSLLEKAIPGFGRIQKTLLAKIEEDLNTTGLPAEVEAQLQRVAAEKGIARGTRGGFNQFSLLKDFGFNLVDWNNAKRARALNTLSTVYGMAPRVNPTSPMAFMVSPGTALNNRWQNANAKYTAEAGAEQARVDAANYNRGLWQAAAQTVTQFGVARGLGGAEALKTADPKG